MSIRGVWAAGFLAMALLPNWAAAGPTAGRRPPRGRPSRAVRSGVEGVALVGPVAPVSRPGVPDEKPLPGAIVVVSVAGGGRELARTRTDAQGRFRVPVAPGRCAVVGLPPEPGSRLPRGTTVEVLVPKGRFARVTLHYDSGIR